MSAFSSDGAPLLKRAAPLAGVAVALALAAHLNALTNPFVYDDIREVVENKSIEGLASVQTVLRHNLARPVVNLSYALDYAVWGGRSPFGFHFTNVLLHAVNVWLLFVVVLQAIQRRNRIFEGSPDRARWAAFLATAVWAVHPLMTEAVGYVSSRSEVLCATFFLGAFACFQQASRSGSAQTGPSPWLAGSAACFLVALGARESAVILPVLLLAYDVLVSADSPAAKRARFVWFHAPLLVLVALAGIARIWLFVSIEYAQAGRAGWSSVLTGIYSFARYLELLVVPIGQTIVPPISPVVSVTDVRFLTAIAVLAGLGAVGLALRRTQPLVVFGFIWFVLLLLPSAALTVLSEYGQPMAEHRMYLAAAGVFMCVAAPAAHWVATPRSNARLRVGFMAATGVVLALLLGLTVVRNRVWSDPVRLWSDAERKAPNTWLAVHGLADAYRQAGDCRAAIPVYQRALELRPERGDSYLGLASCFGETGRVADAGAILRLAVSRVPKDTDLKLRLARVEERDFRDARRALALCEEAAALAPASTEARECVARLRARQQNRLSGRP